MRTTMLATSHESRVTQYSANKHKYNMNIMPCRGWKKAGMDVDDGVVNGENDNGANIGIVHSCCSIR